MSAPQLSWALREITRLSADVNSELAPLMKAVDALSDSFTAEQQDVIVRYLRAAAAEMCTFAEGQSHTASPKKSR